MDFLFEIGLEELPSRYVDETEANLKKIMTEKLTDERISFSDIESFSTPRRVAVIVKNIAEKQQDLDKKSVGPSIEIAYKDGKLTKAGEGFIKSQNASESDVKIVENEKGKYISIETFIAGKTTEEVLPEILDSVVRKIEFEKSMKWSDRTFRFARPIKWFVTLLGDKVLPFEFEGITGSNKTRGMRYFASQDAEIPVPAEYEEVLEKNCVIAKKDKRKEAILKSIKENCESNGDVAVVNNYLQVAINNLCYIPL